MQTTITMKLKRSEKRTSGTRVDGKGWVLYGTREDGKWFERWYANWDAAMNYAGKRGWDVEHLYDEHDEELDDDYEPTKGGAA